MDVLGKALLSLIITVSAVTETHAQCTGNPTATSPGVVQTVIQGEVSAIGCPASQPYPTVGSGRVYYAECKGNAWNVPPEGIGCNTSSATGVNFNTDPCSGTPTPAENSTLMTVKVDVPGNSGTTTVAHFMQCGQNQGWLSGQKVQMSQCVNTNWTSVMDVCTPACDIPRDCSDLALMGFTDDGEYKVIPSGRASGTVISVWCELNSTKAFYAEGGWTHIARQGSYAAGANEVNATLGKKYFIGTEHLKALYLTLAGGPRFYTMQFLLTTDQNVTYFATYHETRVDSSNASLTLLSKYMGNAGNSLINNKNIPWSESSQWWTSASAPANASLISSSDTIAWPSLPGVTITKAIVRIRPKNFDDNRACPPLAPALKPEWIAMQNMLSPTGAAQQVQIMNLNVTLGRSQGATVNYTCLAPLYKEVTSGNVSGSIVCQATGNASAPYAWSASPTFPCQLTCPPNFFAAADGASCYHLSAAPEPKGIVAAALRCSEMNASLAYIRNATNITGQAADGKYYFTTHSMTSTGVPVFPTNLEIACGSGAVCQETAAEQCGVFGKTDTKYINCLDAATHYACMVPAYCPTNFTVHGGSCYKAVQYSGDALDGLLECSKSGAQLAYPQDTATLNFLGGLVRLSGATTPTVALIGLNNAAGDWTQQGLYNVSSDVTNMATGPDKHYALHVPATATEALTLTSVPLTRADLTVVLCQFPGLSICSTQPPAPLADMTRVWNTSMNVGMAIIYSCSPGFFVNGNITVTEQTVTCYGQLGEWLPSILLPCVAVEVCNDTALPVYDLVTVNKSTNPLYMNGTITYTCPAGMLAMPNLTVQNLMCTNDSAAPNGWGYLPAPLPCDASTTAPVVVNATTDWNATAVYRINDTITATCGTNQMIDIQNSTQTLTLTATGWSTSLPCYDACPDAPPAAGTLMTRENFTSNAIGDTLTYTCNAGKFFPTTQAYPAVVSEMTITCTNYTWTPADFNFTECASVCSSSPPAAPTGGNSSWDGFSKTTGTVANLTCPDGYLLGDGNQSKVATCEASGNWTAIDPALLVCRKPVTAPLPALPAGMTIQGLPAGGLTWEGINVSFVCPNNTMASTGETSYIISYNGSHWTEMDPAFVCLNTCNTEPLAPSGRVVYNYTGAPVVGAAVQYYCSGGRFLNGNAALISVCNGTGWNLTSLPGCTSTTPGPSTLPPIVLPTQPPYDVSYPATSDYYWGTLQNNMSDANAVTNNYGTTNGPFGFGYAVKIASSKKQCMIQDKYQYTGDTCTVNPKYCTDGLSISVWEKAIMSLDFFNESREFTAADHKYVLSTGGDEEGHPGIAIYHKGFWLGAVVSTGDKFWKLEVAGPMVNDTWSNIALRWETPRLELVAGKPTEKTGGLELWVNLQKVGHQVEGRTPPAQKQPLDPSLMMVGCHKTQENQTFRGYNDAEYDELAMWTRKLWDNETLFFFGGYERNFSNVDAEVFMKTLERVDLTDPDQQAAAVSIATKLTQEEPTPTVPPAPTSSTGTSSSSSAPTSQTLTSPTATSPTATGAPPSLGDVKKFADRVAIVDTLTDPSNLPKPLTPSSLRRMMEIVEPVSNIFLPSTYDKWRELQKNKTEATPLKIVTNLEQLLMNYGRALKFSNTSEPVYATKAADHIVAQVAKETVDEFKAKWNFYEFPNYNELPGIRSKWHLPYDRVAIPTDLFSDDRCNERSLNIVSLLYDTYDNIALTKVNPANFKDKFKHEIDARVLTVRAECDPQLDEFGKVDPSSPPCVPEHEKLKNNPVRFKLEHNTKTVALRKLQFHQNEVVSEINKRFCAWFNPAIGDNGAWDQSDCKVMESTTEYTKCACGHFGTFTVIAEKVEERVVPEEKLWLTITKYVGYILSFIALIFYIGVIAVSGDLKEQFHLIGLNLSVAVFMGSIFMLVSDMSTVRSDRHTCTAIGSLIHIFYSAAGAWILVLGHASFKAITSGIVSGRLRAYWFLAWSLPLITMGLQYLLFLHDLGLDPRCFISWENNPKWIFFGPQLFCCAVAFVFGTIVLCNMSTPALRKDNLIDDYGSFCHGASFVLIFFTVTWLLGFMAYIRFDFKEPNFYPIFQVFNSWTGLIIFLFIGIGSKRFRMILAGQAKLRREILFGNAFGTPTVPVDDKEHLRVPEDQRSNSSGRSSPVSPSGVNMARPSSMGDDLPSRSAAKTQVAGRPGSRPNSGF